MEYNPKFEPINDLQSLHLCDLQWGDREDMDTELRSPNGIPLICIHMDNDLWAIRKINQTMLEERPSIEADWEVWEAYWEKYYADEWQFDSLHDFVKALTGIYFVRSKTGVWEIPDEVWKADQ